MKSESLARLSGPSPTTGIDRAVPTVTPELGGGHRRSRTAAAIHFHRVPVILTAASLLTGLLFMLLWQPVVYHHQEWAVGGDVWGIWRAAHYVGWGDLGGVYTKGTGVVSLPGVPILLAPFAMLSGRLGLSETIPPFILSHPTAALVIQPIEIVLSSVSIFASAAVANRLGASATRRDAMCVVVALLAWPVGVLWGHAEDTLALAVAMYGLLAAVDRRWSRCGWLFGAAIVIQPLVALLVPLVIAVSPAGQRVRTGLRVALVPLFLIVVCFAGNPTGTWQAIVKQPTPPVVNHATPWVSLAPIVGSAKLGGNQLSTVYVKVQGTFALKAEHLRGVSGVEVSGGPGRFIYVALAIAVALFIWRRPQTTSRLFWFAALVLGARCLFEAVMTPYYLAPPLILALVVASRSGIGRFWSASAVAVVTSVFAYFRLSPWVWWLPVVAGSVVVLALAFPAVSAEDRGPVEADAPTSTAPVDALSLSG